MKHQIVLTNEDHAGPTHNIRINAPDLEVTEDDEAAVVLPEGFDLDTLKLFCINCDCVLIRGEDFEVEAREAWKA